MFFAALTSRSCRVPQDGHVQCRVLRDSSVSRCPQAEQVLLLGWNRSMPDTFRSSITITSWSRTSLVEVRCRKSAREARTLRWARATLALAFARFAEPF